MSKLEVKTYSYYLNAVPNENWAYTENIFNDEEIKKIIEISKNKDLCLIKKGTIGIKDNFKKIRNSDVSFIRSDVSSLHWIFEKITQHINFVNEKYFKFNLNNIELLQVTKYDSKYKGKYGKHVDTHYLNNSVSEIRKLSFTIQLSDEKSYEGGDLLIHTEEIPTKINRKKGMCTFFPSYTLHEVTPVVKGERHSLVGWVLGPKFK